MIADSPSWSFRRWGHVAPEYADNVHLLPDRVVGLWYCIERSTGGVQWLRWRYVRPNSIVGIDSGVIVACEFRFDGLHSVHAGCYGISLETGKLLWTSHADGLWGVLLRTLDFPPIPGFGNGLRDRPIAVKDGFCLCASGRVLDVRTGRRAEDIPNPPGPKTGKSAAEVLYEGSLAKRFTRIPIGNGVWLSRKRSAEEDAKAFRLYALRDDGSVQWHFDLQATGRFMSHANYFSHRYADPYVYIVASETPYLRPAPPPKPGLIACKTRFHIMALDVRRGEIVQDVSVGGPEVTECDIQAVDEQGLVIRVGAHELRYYGRKAD